MLDTLIACLSFPIAMVLGGVLFTAVATDQLQTQWRVILVISLSIFAWYGLFRFAGSWGLLTNILGYVALVLAMALLTIGFIWVRSLPLKWPVLVLVFTAALSVVTAVPLGYELSDQAQTKLNGDLFVQAAKAYYADHGVYPAKLLELIPKYLHDWPKIYGKPGWPGYSFEWAYQALPDRFFLGFAYPEFEDDQELCVYASDVDYWSCGFSYWSLLSSLIPRQDELTQSHGAEIEIVLNQYVQLHRLESQADTPSKHVAQLRVIEYHEDCAVAIAWFTESNWEPAQSFLLLREDKAWKVMANDRTLGNFQLDPVWVALRCTDHEKAP